MMIQCYIYLSLVIYVHSDGKFITIYLCRETQSLTDSNNVLTEDNMRLKSERDEMEHQLEQLSKELDRRDRDLEVVIEIIYPSEIIILYL